MCDVTKWVISDWLSGFLKLLLVILFSKASETLIKDFNKRVLSSENHGSLGELETHWTNF